MIRARLSTFVWNEVMEGLKPSNRTNEILCKYAANEKE
jgi:hypothetical protein